MLMEDFVSLTPKLKQRYEDLSCWHCTFTVFLAIISSDDEYDPRRIRQSRQMKMTVVDRRLFQSSLTRAWNFYSPFSPLGSHLFHNFFAIKSSPRRSLTLTTSSVSWLVAGKEKEDQRGARQAEKEARRWVYIYVAATYSIDHFYMYTIALTTPTPIVHQLLLHPTFAIIELQGIELRQGQRF